MNKLFISFFLFLVLFFCVVVPAQPTLIADQGRLNEHGVSIISYPSPQFIQSISSILKGQAISMVEPALPFSIIIQNNSPHSIIGLVIVYSTERQDDRPYITTRILSYDGTPRSYRKKPYIEAGESRFESLISSFSKAINGGYYEKFINDKGPSYLIAMRQIESFMHRGSTRVSLDSIIFDNGNFIGPDTCNIYDSYLIQHSAVHELYLRLAMSISAGSENVRQELNSIMSTPVRLGMTPTDLDFYKTRERDAAKLISFLLDRRGLEFASREITFALNNWKPFNLRKISY